MNKNILNANKPRRQAYACRYPLLPLANTLWQGSPWRAFRLLSGR